MSRSFEALQEAATRISSTSGTGPHVADTGVSAIALPIRNDADDQVVALVQRLFLSSQESEPRQLIVFCGVDRGAGCSWVCARAAELLAAQVPGRVCVVDANLRSPSLHAHFHVERAPGFADAIEQTEPIEQFISPTPSRHLWIMSSGCVRPAPNGALNPGRLQARFAELRERFDFLLVDVPAITAFSDAAIIGQISDGLVLVIASNATRRDAARMAKQSLEDAKVLILGAVLNKRTFPIPEAVYRRL